MTTSLKATIRDFPLIIDKQKEENQKAKEAQQFAQKGNRQIDDLIGKSFWGIAVPWVAFT